MNGTGPTVAVAVAVTIFRPAIHREAEVALWQLTIDRAASQHAGFLGSRFATHTDDEQTWVAALSFARPEELNAWLVSDERRTLLDEAVQAGLINSIEPDVVLTPGTGPPPGTAVFLHNVEAGAEMEFLEAEASLQTTAGSFPGFHAAAIFAPGIVPGSWVSVISFSSDENLDGWLRSPERADALERLRPTLCDTEQAFTARTPFGSVVRADGGTPEVTPAWRSAMVVLAVLFPTVMVLSRRLTPILGDLGVTNAPAVFLSNVVSVGLLTWVLMPLATKILHRWLDPVDGRDRRTTAIGIGVIGTFYLLSLLLFTTVPALELGS